MSGMLHGGPGDPRPIPTSLNEARNEMRRLMVLMMGANRSYLKREATVIELHRQGKQNYSGDLITVMNKDLLLAGYSGMSKTMSVLVQGLAAYIQAEMSMKQANISSSCICGGDQAPWAGHSAPCRNQTGERT